MGISAIIDSIRSAAVPQTADIMELYRREVFVPSGSAEAPVRISFLDVHPRRFQNTLVLLHGFAANSAWWRPQLAALAGKNRVIVIDARGNGLSAHTESGNSIAQQVADIFAVLDSLGVAEPVIAAGHSSGGFVATELALSQPERVKKLILVATPFAFKGSSTMRIARLFMSFPDFFFRIGQSIYELDPRGQASILGLKRLFLDSLVKWDGQAKYPNVSQPTLVIGGQRDSLFPAESYQQVGTSIPQSSLVEIGVSKHQVTLERPKAVLRAMLRFIDPESPFRPPWRSENDEIETVGLLAKRPWIALYDDMPPELIIPRVPLNNLLAYTIRQFGKQKAILYLNEGKEQKFSYAELDQEIALFSQVLSEMGLKKGSRLFLLLPNMPQMIIAFFAALRLGAVAVLANPLDAEDILLQQAREVGAAVLICTGEQESLAAALKAQTAVQHIIYASERDYDPDLLREHLKEAKEHEDSADPANADDGSYWIDFLVNPPAGKSIYAQVTAADPAAIIFSSGPNYQAVTLSHENLLAGSIQIGAWLSNLDHGEGSFLAAVPYSDAYGLLVGVLAAVHKAAQIIIPSGFQPDKLLAGIKQAEPVIVLGTPALYRELIQIYDLAYQLPDKRPVFLSAGAPLPVEIEEVFERLSRCKLHELYGLTESCYVACATPIGRDRTGSVGLPLPNCDLQIVDLASGQPLPFDNIGELQLRGPQVAASDAQEEDIWLSTGDLAEMDDDGYFRIIGRVADFCDRDGIRVYLRDIEESILEMPGADDVAAQKSDSQIIVYINSHPDERLTGDDVADFCRRRLPASHQPDRFIFLPTIPRDRKGRLLRQDLPAQ